MGPLVSVIVPVYNLENYIGKCLSSLKEQSYSDVEIIVINDGSTDGSLQILNNYAASDPRIVIIDQENAGVSAARNAGISAASGEYLLFVDGDDYVGSGYIRSLVEAAEPNSADLVIGGYTSVSSDSSSSVSPSSYSSGSDEMWAYRLMAAWGRLYRKDFWERNGFSFTLEKNARAEDIPICLCANYLAANLTVVPDSSYYYVQRSGSAMTEFAGFGKYRFPKEAFENVRLVLESSHPHSNSRDFFVYGILKTFAMFSFQLSKGAEKKVRRSLDSYLISFVKGSIPDYSVCIKRVNKKGLPLHIRAATALFCLKVRFSR